MSSRPAQGDRIRLVMTKWGGRPHWEHHFDALKRMLDRREPDYRD